jgi:hypothetical protein
MIEQNKAIHDLPQEGKARHQEIVRELRQPESQFKKRRVAIKIEEFKEKCDKDRPRTNYRLEGAPTRSL